MEQADCVCCQGTETPTPHAMLRKGNAMKPETGDIEAVIKEALAKYETGRKAYGQLDLDTDSRDYVNESIEEMLDAINYLCFQIIRLRSKRDV